MLVILNVTMTVHREGIYDDMEVYVRVMFIEGQIVVFESDLHVNKEVKEECLKYVTPYRPSLRHGVVRGYMVSCGGTLGAAPADRVPSGGDGWIVIVAVAPSVPHLLLHDILYS